MFLELVDESNDEWLELIFLSQLMWCFERIAVLYVLKHRVGCGIADAVQEAEGYNKVASLNILIFFSSEKTDLFTRKNVYKFYKFKTKK